MKKHLLNPVFKIIAEESEAMKSQAFVIGGYVRDIFLKRNSKDIDVVVTGSGIELARRVASRLGREVPVSYFKNFGTAMIRYEDLEIGRA